MPSIHRLVLWAALVACAPRPALAQAPAAADRAQAYAAAVRHWQGSADRYVVLDPAGLTDDGKTADAGAVERTPEIVSRLLATGLFDGVCEIQPRDARSVCPDSVPGTRVRFLPPVRAAGDTLQFEVAYAALPRPGGSTRLFRVSYLYRVARVDGAWTVVETRRRSIT
jgi:hypothetical protein